MNQRLAASMTLDLNKKDVCCINYIHSCMTIIIIIIVVLDHVGELPVTIDLVRYDRDPGYHNITIITNSTTRRQAADYTYPFLIPGMHQ